MVAEKRAPDVVFSDYGPPQMLWQLLTYQRAPRTHTREFRAMSHNADLCPAVSGRCNDLLRAFSRYHEIAYDIQGLRDEGIDVVVRVGQNPGENLIGLQIKSNKEMSEKGVKDKLILQWDRARDHYGDNLIDYYILLCCDSESNMESIRKVQTAFSKKPVSVIAPEYILTFLKLSPISMDAWVRLQIGSGDVVIRAARESVNNLTLTETGLLLFGLNEAFFNHNEAMDLQDFQSSRFLQDLYARYPDIERNWIIHSDHFDDDHENDWVLKDQMRDAAERTAADINVLEGDCVAQSATGQFAFDLAALEPVLAVLLDGHLRYDYEGDDLLRYGLEIVAPDKVTLMEQVREEMGSRSAT